MKKIISLLMLLPLIACAQQSDSYPQYVWREGWHVGLGIGQMNYNTHWNFIGATGAGFTDDRADHSSDKTMLFLSLEKRSLFGKKREKDFADYYVPMYYSPGFVYWGSFKFYVDFDFGVEAMYGIAGKTTADFLNDNNNVISSGGLTMGAGAYFRASQVVPLHKVNMILLSLSVNPAYVRIHNNAKDVSTYPLAENYRDNPWNESIFTLNGTIGTAGFEFGKISIIPELRLRLFGTASSSLKTDNSTVSGEQSVSSQQTPGFWGWGIKLTKKL
jgi:hypothetical protein